MKNIYVIPTDKPSRLVKIKDNLFYTTTENIPGGVYQHIYITSDEEIKEGDWFLSKEGIVHNNWGWNFGDKKIILTTDQDLIKDGVQAIDDEFLEWFVKNPSCEEVEIKTYCCQEISKNYCDLRCGKETYKIIIPKEEAKQELIELKKQFQIKADEALELNSNIGNFGRPKQETLEEAAERLYPISKGGSMWMPSKDDCNKANKQEGFIEGAKSQQERSYSEEEVMSILINSLHSVELKDNKNYSKIYNGMKEWFEQNKKK